MYEEHFYGSLVTWIKKWHNRLLLQACPFSVRPAIYAVEVESVHLDLKQLWDIIISSVSLRCQ